MNETYSYDKEEIKEILDYAIRKIEQNISTIKDQQIEIDRLKKELEKSHNMSYNYNYEKEEQIRRELKENAKKEAELIISEARNNANKSVPVSAPEYICHLTNPCLWNGKTSPKLYVVVAGLIVNGSTEDQIVLPFGLRDLSMESNSSVLVNGLCVPEKDLIRTLESDPFVYDDMDEDGSFACVELKELCDIAADEKDCRNLLTEYVLQNAYHPSILCWKLPEDHADFAALLRELDSTRPVLF